MTDTPDDDKPVETGLLGSTPVPVPVPVLVTAPVTAVTPVAPNINVDKQLELIREIAHNLYDVDYILKQHNLTQANYDWLMANAWFKNAVETEQKEWFAASNAQTRLAIQTALALENALPALSQRMKAPTEPLQSQVALAKLFAEIAGTVGGAQKQDNSPQAKFKIVFNLGADVQQFDKTRPFIQINDGGDTTLQSLLEAPGVPAPLQTDPKGSGN